MGHLCSGQQLEGTYLYPPCGMQVVQPLLRTGRDKEEQIPEKLPVLLPPSGTARRILYVIIYIYILIYIIMHISFEAVGFSFDLYIYIFGV